MHQQRELSNANKLEQEQDFPRYSYSQAEKLLIYEWRARHGIVMALRTAVRRDIKNSDPSTLGQTLLTPRSEKTQIARTRVANLADDLVERIFGTDADPLLGLPYVPLPQVLRLQDRSSGEEYVQHRRLEGAQIRGYVMRDSTHLESECDALRILIPKLWLAKDTVAVLQLPHLRVRDVEAVIELCEQLRSVVSTINFDKAAQGDFEYYLDGINDCLHDKQIVLSRYREQGHSEQKSEQLFHRAIQDWMSILLAHLPNYNDKHYVRQIHEILCQSNLFIPVGSDCVITAMSDDGAVVQSTVSMFSKPRSETRLRTVHDETAIKVSTVDLLPQFFYVPGGEYKEMYNPALQPLIDQRILLSKLYILARGSSIKTRGRGTRQIKQAGFQVASQTV